jgi:hypothetical protein
VAADDAVVILESMKMEIPVLADGQVRSRRSWCPQVMWSATAMRPVVIKVL